MIAILSERIAAKKFTISERARIHLDGARHIFDEETLTFVSFKFKSYQMLLWRDKTHFF